MKRKVSMLVALVAALCIARVSAAQDAPAAGSAPAAQTPPPPGYPPPPPRAPAQAGGYPYQYQYPNQYPPPPPDYAPARRRGWNGYYYPERQSGVYRPFSLSIGVGPGYLHGWSKAGDSESDVALSYNLFRLGIGIVPNLSFVLAFEGMGTDSTSPFTGESSWLSQHNWLLGLQYHFLQRMYVRGCMGLGTISQTSPGYDDPGLSGLATEAAIGYEFVQTPHVALALDANGSVTRYSDQYWSTAGLNLAVSFY